MEEQDYFFELYYKCLETGDVYYCGEIYENENDAAIEVKYLQEEFPENFYYYEKVYLT